MEIASLVKVPSPSAARTRWTSTEAERDLEDMIIDGGGSLTVGRQIWGRVIQQGWGRTIGWQQMEIWGQHGMGGGGGQQGRVAGRESLREEKDGKLTETTRLGQTATDLRGATTSSAAVGTEVGGGLGRGEVRLERILGIAGGLGRISWPGRVAIGLSSHHPWIEKGGRGARKRRAGGHLGRRRLYVSSPNHRF